MGRDATRYDLIVAGLGPVGAVAANLAGVAGLRTLVIEKSDVPYDKPRAIVFDAEIMRVFASIGLADDIAAVTKPLGGSVYLGADRAPIRTFRAHPRAHEKAWFPSNLFYQPQLEAILRAGLGRFPHVTVVTGVAVEGVSQDDRGVILTIADRNGSWGAEADHLFACDGASSGVRKALGIALDDIGFEERWLVVDTDVTGPMRWPSDHVVPDEVRDGRFSLMVCDPDRPATLIPGRGMHRRWEYMLLPDEHDEEVVTDAWLKPQLAKWVDPGDVAIIRTAVYRFRALVAERWRDGRVFLLGDAAHQTPPFFGQGMCHGIRDAAQLIWKLMLVRAGVADGGMLDSYQAEREPHVRTIIAASVAAGAEVCKLDRAEALARDARFRAVERERTRSVAMTDVVPQICDGIIDPSNGGERLPEFVLKSGAGDQHIDALLAGRFSLIARNAVAPRTGVWATLGGQVIHLAPGACDDADGRLSAWFDERGARWAIVRPDRYLYALGSGDAALNAALALLARQLHPGAPQHPGSTTMEASPS
ncbi:MAG: bifunctional 3-(3-hydroxy-phenyl)propionate/3-hydroxycinnamic acid hydroxylase [Sphingomonas sp.]|jgi:3-(3-hydroxy-phenyl)propionate hydroxylase|uniref:bifunctional 3-(3-hydroxy-phenyl)propionate/3-hydroxycinnamic acid hydroxylase n=1 Tax=Sphingomonas sp. TaxID=28214 RepID=UPI00356B1129